VRKFEQSVTAEAGAKASPTRAQDRRRIAESDGQTDPRCSLERCRRADHSRRRTPALRRRVGDVAEGEVFARALTSSFLLAGGVIDGSSTSPVFVGDEGGG